MFLERKVYPKILPFPFDLFFFNIKKLYFRFKGSWMDIEYKLMIFLLQKKTKGKVYVNTITVMIFKVSKLFVLFYLL